MSKHKIEELNCVMEIILNRALLVDKKNKIIIVDFDDTYEGLLTYTIAHYGTTFKQLKFYSNKQLKSCRFFESKDKTIKVLPQWIINILLKKKTVLHWLNVDIENCIYLFRTFDKDLLKEIAEEFYAWNDDSEKYKQHIEEMKQKQKEQKNG